MEVGFFAFVTLGSKSARRDPQLGIYHQAKGKSRLVRVSGCIRSVRKLDRTESVGNVSIARGTEVVCSKAMLVVLGR